VSEPHAPYEPYVFPAVDQNMWVADERAAIMEFDGGLNRSEAEKMAARDLANPASDNEA
jgi:hypothetical protein